MKGIRVLRIAMMLATLDGRATLDGLAIPDGIVLTGISLSKIVQASTSLPGSR